MAEQSDRHVVNQAQSMGDHSSIDVTGTSQTTNAESGGEEKVEVSIPESHPFEEPASSRPSEAAVFEDIAKSNPEPADQPSVEHSRPSSIDTSTITGVDKGGNMVNENSEEHNNPEESGPQALAEGDTAGLDMDPNKVDGVEQTLDPYNKTETLNTSKKPATFKAVSVTKNFLAKSAAGIGIIAKLPVDKAIPPTVTASAAPLIAKPRLVAKTGKDARIGTLRTGGGGSAGPDASQVWNRNKPAAPAAPKAFTDEELKQQYGIQLATRLGADEDGRDPKWADIDEDEDNWLPDPVTWMDGTKSSTGLVDTELGQLGGAQADIGKASEDASKDLTGLSQRPSSISSLGKTILRPGTRTLTQTKPGLVLRSVPENASKTEKPTTAASSRSPWAALPPVDKVSPVSFTPPVMPPRRASPPVPHGPSNTEETARAPSPAREIGPDDFNRTWREGEKGSRELFNSQSGRYEPVKAQRRLSRHEHSGRPASVLQRPSQQGHSGPAEPSAAFQPIREGGGGGGGHDGSAWTRRRGSSSKGDRKASQGRLSEATSENVAADSLASPTTQQANLKQGETASEGQNTATLPLENSSDVASHAQHPASDAVQQSPSSQIQAYSARSADRPTESAPPAGPALQEARVAQQQLMRERIELNRKRKQEEEAREEAARKERIKLKMDALVKQPASASEVSTAEQPSQTESPKPATVLAASAASQPQGLRISDAHDPTSQIPQTQPRSRSHPEKKSSNDVISLPSHVEPPTSTRPQFVPAKSPELSAQLPQKTVSDVNLSNPGSTEVQQLPGLGQAPPSDRMPQQWSTLPGGASPSTGWAGNNRPTHSGNVWGPPSNDRPLGNGAFAGEFHRLSTSQRPHHPASQNPMNSPQPGRPSSMSPSIPFDVSHALPSPPQPFGLSHADVVLPNQQWYQGPTHATPPFSQNGSMTHRSDRGFQPLIDQDQAAKRAWRDFPSVAARHDADAREARTIEGGRTDGGQDFQPTFKETFRQTMPGDVLGSRQVVSVSKTTHDGHTSVIDGVGNGSPQPIAPPYPQSAQQAAIAPPHIASRPSRFFGPGIERNLQPPTDSGPVHGLGPQEPASPPPPDSLDHPAFVGQSHPMVHLPSPAPKVKLPPAPLPDMLQSSPLNLPPSSSDHVVQASRFRSGPQPIVNQAAWQDRFKSLFERGGRSQSTQVPPSSSAQRSPSLVQPALAVETSSKAVLDVSTVRDAATVSLPQGLDSSKDTTTRAALPDHHIESKPTEEELVEEREFGHIPTVNLPRTPHANLSILQTLPPPRYGSKAAQIEQSREFGSSVFPLSFESIDAEQKVENGIRIYIRILGRPLRTKILHERTMDSPSPRPSKMARKTKRNSSGKTVNGGGPAFQAQENLMTRNDASSATKSPRADPERRTGWGKSQKFGKGPQYGNVDASVSDPHGTRPQEVSQDAHPRQRRQQSRGDWAKPIAGFSG